MPRPRNLYLLEIFGSEIQGNTIACNNGNCNGKLLNTHAANLERHLKQVHPDIYSYYIQNKYEKMKMSSPKTVNATPNKAKTKMPFSPLSISTIKETIPRIKETQSNGDLQLAVVEFFTKNSWALPLMEDQAFNLLMKPAFHLLAVNPSEENIIQIISEYFQKWKKHTISMLKGKLLSLKMDVIKCQDWQIMGISVQYMEINTIKFFTLAIKDLSQCENLNLLIEEILKDYQIERKQIVTLTMEQGEIEQNIPNLSEDMENDSEDLEMGNFYLQNIKSQLEFFDSKDISLVYCGSDVLQLCAQDVLEVPNVLEKLKKFSVLSKELNTQTFMKLESKDSMDSLKNWIFIYEKLEILLEILKAQSSENLNEDEMNFLLEFIKLFHPLYNATIKLQREQQSWSDLYIVIMDILFQMKDMPESDLKQLLVRALTQRKDELFQMDLFTAAIYLDPRIKICLSAEEKERSKKCITDLGQRMSELKDQNPDGFEIIVKEEKMETPTSSTSATSPSQNDSLFRSFSEYLYNLDSSNTTESKYDPLYISLETDFILYERLPRLPLDLNLSAHWSSQKNSLATIAEIILAIPCTIHSSTMKSLMASLRSSYGQRERMSADYWEQLLLVRINGEFVYNM